MPLDRLVKERLRLPYVRYMDDLVCWAADREQLKAARQEITAFASEHFRLEMKPAVKLNRTSAGLNFLGFRVLPAECRLSRLSAHRFREKMRKLASDYAQGRISELEYQQRSTCLCAFTQRADARSFRQRWIWGVDSRARTA